MTAATLLVMRLTSLETRTHGIVRPRAVRFAGAALFWCAALGPLGCLEPDQTVLVHASLEPPRDDLPLAGARFAPDDDGFADTALVELAGAGNETVTFCMTALVGAEPVSKPDLQVSALAGVGSSIESSAVRVYRMHTIPVTEWPGWHVRSIPPQERNAHPFDVLVPVRAPLGGLPSELSPGESYHFWVDLTIPIGTFAGVYNGTIDLCSGGRTVASTAIQLTVWPFVLPDDIGISCIGQLDHRRLFRHHVTYQGAPYAPAVDDWRHDPLSERLDNLLSSTARMLRAHRISPVLDTLAPIAKIAADGGLALSWEQYDEAVGLCAEGRPGFDLADLNNWPLPVTQVLSSTRRTGSLDTGSYDASVGRYVAACAEHFALHRALAGVFAMSPNRLPMGREAIGDALSFANTVRSSAPGVRIVTRGCPQDMRPYGWVDYPYQDLSDVTDVWLVPGQFYDPQALTTRDHSRVAWLGVDRPPFTGSIAPCAPPSAARVLAWQCKRLGAAALHLGSINPWPSADDNPAPEDCVRAAPNALIYPGGAFGLDEPVPSVRLKLLRRSFEDVAYARILEAQGLAHVGSTICESIVPYAGANAYRTHFADGKRIAWPADPATFDDARRIMAEELTGSTREAAPRRDTESLARSVAWRRFMEKTRRLELAVDGTRIRFVGTADAPYAEVEVTVTARNGTRLPIEGRLGFGPLPAGWTWEPDAARSHTLPPGTARHLTLTGKTTVVPTEPGGYVMLPIELIAADGTTYRADARVSFVTADPAVARPVIDGDLTDWPAGSTNVAGDFRLITYEMSNRPDPATSRPKYQTTAFIMRDKDNLYVAVNCRTDLSMRPPPARRSGVRYDDLIPMDEDLIELLIDPLNAGTRSPSDLFHVVVKRSGPCVTGIGIQTDPPCGRCSPWPVGLEYASNDSAPGRWTIEISIPLAAFDAAATERTTWGLNIARHDAANQEVSTWSGACRNAYDPLSLGNLQLP